MNVSVNEIGMILHGLYMSDYFKSENIEESIEQLITDHKNVVSIVPDKQHIGGEKLTDTGEMKTKIYKIDFGYMAIIQAENEGAALEIYRNTVGYVEKSEEKDFISNLVVLSSEEAIEAMKDFVAGPEELEQLGKDTAIKLIKEDYNQVLLNEYP